MRPSVIAVLLALTAPPLSAETVDQIMARDRLLTPAERTTPRVKPFLGANRSGLVNSPLSPAPSPALALQLRLPF